MSKTNKIDLVVYSAGIYSPMPLTNYDHKICMETINTNLIGAFNLFEVIKNQAVSKNDALHIVWIASLFGYNGLPSCYSYGASKAGLINFAQVQRCELQKLNTKVQVVNPGFVRTRNTGHLRFPMPTIIPSEKAAHYIYKGIKSSAFEIAFPTPLAFLVKLLRILPDYLYFKIADRLPM